MIQLHRIQHFKDLIEKEEISIANLSAQLQKIQDQLDYHKDKLQYHQEQLRLLQAK